MYDPNSFSDSVRYYNFKPSVMPPTTFRPVRPVAPIVPIGANPVTPTQITATTVTAAAAGAPEALLSISATQEPVKQNNQTASKVFVQFSHDPSDVNFDHINVWVQGYHGSTTPTLVASGSESPVTFVLDATGETVIVIGQAASTTAVQALADSLANLVTLSGVSSAPPAPTISQTLTATPLGYQFAFDQVDLSGTQDVMASYKVYRNTTNTFSGSTLLQTIAQDPTATGAIVVQDRVGGGQTYYYFVTAVDTSGRESGHTSAQSGAVTSGSASLDSDVADGATYGRVNNTALTTGNIDFAKAGFANKTLDHVIDGSTYARVKGTELTSGTVAQLNDGTNVRTAAHAAAAFDSVGNLTLKNITGVNGTTVNPNTSSATYVVMPEMTHTITTKGNPVLLLFSGIFQTSSGEGEIAIFRDGSQVTTDYIVPTVSGGSGHIPFSIAFIDQNPTAASHTYDVRWLTVGTFITNVGTTRGFQAVELG